MLHHLRWQLVLAVAGVVAIGVLLLVVTSRSFEVRPAAGGLLAEGLVVQEGSKTILVAPVNTEDFIEIMDMRALLEPLFIQYNVSLVLNGHDHTYERIKLQNGILYFVEGSAGQLRKGDLRKGSPLTAFGTDSETTFILMEIDGDTLTYNTITASGSLIDSGTFQRRK